MFDFIRDISVFFRQKRQKKDELRSIVIYKSWLQQIYTLTTKREPNNNKVAIIRLDDIGDFILWHNFLFKYKQLYLNHQIVLIGNIVWKELFETLCPNTVDSTIWIDKKQYFKNSNYRLELWKSIRNENFSITICPSRTRPLLLDDIICAASNASLKIAHNNTLPNKNINKISDKNYTKLFHYNLPSLECTYNRKFTKFIGCDTCDNTQLKISLPNFLAPTDSFNIVCFIGASAKSKRWGTSKWIQLIQLLQEQNFKPLLLGGKNEINTAKKIVLKTNVHSLVGVTTLTETLQNIATAKAVISGDTMAVHAAIALSKPLIILANGVNASRFTEYEAAGYNNVKTIYTKNFLNSKKNKGFVAVSQDMESIMPKDISKSLIQLLK